MKDFELTLKLRNNRLKRRREELGLSAPKFAARAGLSYGVYIALETMRRSPLQNDGAWRPSALQVASYYGEPPEALWPAQVLEVVSSEQKVELDAHALKGLASVRELYLDNAPVDPERLLMERETAETLRELTRQLAPVEYSVLRGWLEGDRTLEQLGAAEGLSRERARQLVESALGKLRQPARANALRFADPDLAEPSAVHVLAAPCAGGASPEELQDDSGPVVARLAGRLRVDMNGQLVNSGRRLILVWKVATRVELPRIVLDTAQIRAGYPPGRHGLFGWRAEKKRNPARWVTSWCCWEVAREDPQNVASASATVR